MKPKLVVLSGAGMSAESGLATFRGSDGLWEGHKIEEVATWEGWKRNREKVLDFYNARRQQLAKVQPNEGHRAIQALESDFSVHIITQNVDDLHERAGSKNVLHLHGQLTQARSTVDEYLIYDISYRDIALGDTCEKGSQLRPHIVWFGELVPAIEEAVQLTRQADIFVVVGTSLQVYPAASLLDYVPYDAQKFAIDIEKPRSLSSGIQFIQASASEGLKRLREIVIETL
ncbi:NAD-dependent deacylase [Cytophagales bacterium LB-30]|uniref:NAD-dependent protein deacylase n=1 Tax=Shiella aurantiaca TaxID=3058365 RepID=A0ABT8F1P7_9BACT|nr:NAD-dependent deacylase [Shiella aurantiaca]MDN4164330.1 NAD-dependent deacylase [Shiella aurantiaca]